MQIPAKLRVVLGTLAFVFVVFHCFFTGLDRLGFVGPDEPRYAAIARSMARTGDWITPRLNGAPWFEKPPLYYWSGALGFRLFSSPEIAARAPSGVFALCAVLALALLAKRLYGSATAFAFGMMLPATVAMTGFARAAATDMPFAACLTLAMAAAGYMLLDESPAHLRALAAAFGATLGLAVLAKGPAAILLAGGSTALWAVASGNIRHSFRLFHPAALAAFGVAAVPWYALCASRNPGFLRIFFLEHNVERFLTNRYQHHQPFWFFVPILLIAVFPWTLLIVPALADARRSLRTEDWHRSPGVFFAAWVLFPLVFFSASQSKLPGYILPAVPPLVLLLARALAVSREGAVPARRTRLLWGAMPLIGAGIVAILLVAPAGRLQIASTFRSSPPIVGPITLVGISLLIGALVVAGASLLRSIELSATIAAFVFSFCTGMAVNHILPILGPDISPREIAYTAREITAGAPLAVLDLPRAWQYGAEFYLDRAIPELTPTTPRPVWVLGNAEGVHQLVELPRGSFRRYPVYGRAALYRLE
ncbi:MAG TPA: glycosyltransferase family 39 protein [Candidatus Solibacter sp.]|nr:glycosyltransferase family 39 protein [Candidatus Solibacter sp.]